MFTEFGGVVFEAAYWQRKIHKHLKENFPVVMTTFPSAILASLIFPNLNRHISQAQHKQLYLLPE